MCKTELFISKPTRRVRALAQLSVLFVCLVSNWSARAVGSLSLAWDPSPASNLSGYVVRYATTSSQYTMSTNVGSVTAATVGGLQDGVTYYFAVTAINTSGLESDPSNEVGYTMPVTSAPTISTISGRTIAEDSPITVAFTIASASVPLSSLTLAAISSNTNLVPASNIVFGGSQSNRTATVTPALNRSGVATITITVNDGVRSASSTFALTVSAVNDVPTIASITDRSILEDAAAQTVSLTGIGSGAPDEAQTLSLVATSSNPSLIANPTVSYISPGATGNLTFAPVANASGTATITVTVNDGQALNNVAMRSFSVTVAPVNDLPTISNIAEQNIDQGSSTVAIGFTVGDLETPVSNLFLSSASSNPTLVPSTNIVFGGSGSSRTVTITPVSGQSGTATIAVYVTDGDGGSSADTFTLTVAAPSSPPSIVLTSPTSGGSLTAPATINLAATVTANGNAITKVQFFNGATLLGEDSSTPYNITWSGVTAGSYAVSARVIYGSGSVVDSPSVNVVVSGLPAPWQTVDIGTVGVAGSASALSGTYTVNGAGNISGTADNFCFVYQSLSGDGEIRFRINSAADTGTSGRAGVMIRESLTSGSRYAFMGISPDGTFRWHRRTSTSGNTSSTTSTVGALPNVWVRLVRTGNSIYGYSSVDGVTWTKVSSRNISMAANIYVGLAVASGNSTTLNTSSFSSAAVIP